MSARGVAMPDSPIRKLVSYASRARARGIGVIHLNIGQPDLPAPPEVYEAIRGMDPGILAYTPSDGLSTLREKLAGYYARFGMQIDPGQIIVTSGGSEAVTFAFMACLDPGDEIIVPEPAYANYTAFAISAGAVIRPVTTRIEEGFALPPVGEFERLVTPRTRGIMICNPNNPTGYLYSREEMRQIGELAVKHDLFLFSDEVYREFCYTEAPYVPAFSLEGIGDHVILVDSVSKRYSACGLRVGALVVKNREVHAAVMKFCQARLSPPLVGQIAAEAAIGAGADYMAEACGEYRRRRDVLVEGLNRIPGVFAPFPMGAFYAMARLPVADTDHFCRWMLSDFSLGGRTLFLAPASGFYSTPGAGANEVRIAFNLNKEELKSALTILEAALACYCGKS